MPEQRGGEDKLTKGVGKEETKSKPTNKDNRHQSYSSSPVPPIPKKTSQGTVHIQERVLQNSAQSWPPPWSPLCSPLTAHHLFSVLQDTLPCSWPQHRRTVYVSMHCCLLTIWAPWKLNQTCAPVHLTGIQWILAELLCWIGIKIFSKHNIIMTKMIISHKRKPSVYNQMLLFNIYSFSGHYSF